MIFQYYFAFIVFALHNLCLAQISNFDYDPSKSPPNFESIVSFSSFPNENVKFQPAQSTAAETSDSFGKPTFSFPGENNFSQPIATADTSAGSSFQAYQPSTIPSSLETFTSAITDAVHTSPILSNLFDITPTSLQSFQDFIHQNAHKMFESLGIPDPLEVATYTSHPLTESFEILTYPMLVRINAQALGKQLLAERILNDTNSISLALAFAKEMENSAEKTVQKNDPKSKFQALFDGYVGFLKSQSLYTPEKMANAGRYYGDEVKIAGNRFGIRARNYASANN